MSKAYFSAYMNDRLNQTFVAVALVGAAWIYFLVGLDLHW